MKNSPVSPTGEQSQSHVGRVAAAVALLIGWAVVAVNLQLERINELAQANAPLATEQMVWLTRIVAFAFSLAVLILGAWMIWIGHRTCRADRFPPPGVKLIRRIRCQTGAKAKVIGWIGQVAGVAILVLGTTVSWMFVQLAEFLLRQ